MDPQGMVHALEEIRRLLTPDGFLIDIHPIRKAPLFQVQQGNNFLLTESDPAYDYDEGLRQADEALEQVIRRGLFLVEGRNEFESAVYASTAAEMRDYWMKYGAFNDEPKDETMAARKDEMYARAGEIMRNAPGSEISYHERARIMRLRPVM